MSYAQENATAYVYHPLSEFGTDTLRFLKTNFERKSGYFKGKPLGEVLKYYKKDLPIQKYMAAKEKEFKEVAPQAKSINEIEEEWQDYYEQIKAQAVENEEFKVVD